MQILLRILLLILCLRAATTTNEDYLIYTDCPSDTNYTSGSAFQANLNKLLSSLPGAAAASSGFAKDVIGAAPDQAYGLVQCRADVNTSDCRACLDDAAREVISGCPGQKSAMIMHEYCLLRHSNTSFIGAADKSLAVYVCNSQNSTQPEQFMSRVGALISNLIEKAAYGTPRMFAAGATELTPFVKLYGMARCTQDLAADDCHLCLSSAVAYIPKLCDGKLGGRIIHRSCSVRFEVGPFYNAQAVEVAMSPAPAPAPAPAPVSGSGPANRNDNIIGPQSTGQSTSPVPVAMRLLVFLLGILE